MLEFRILGPFEVIEDGRSLALGTPKQRALLAILLLRRGEVVSTDRLIDQLWGERPPATAAKTLQGYVSHLRKALGDGVLVTRGGGYILETEQVDADRFAALVAQAHDAAPADARRLLGDALGLWRGEPLADLAYEPFAQGEVARLHEARLAALEDRVDADLALGRHRRLAAELEGLAAEHPNRERLLAQLMLALYRSGRQSDALDAYRRGRGALDEQLGLEPGPELRALEQRILTHDAALGAPAALPRAAERARRGRTLIVAGGALLLAAALAAAIVRLTGGGDRVILAAPNSIAAIDTHGNRVVGQVPVGARPGAIAFGAGSLWVANVDDQTVSRVDPVARRTLRTLAVKDPPTGIAAAGGRIWVATSGPPAASISVRSIDPRFDAIARTIQLDNLVPGSPAPIAARGAALWVAPFAGELTRLDPESGRVVQRLDPNAGPVGMALGAGAAWVTDGEAGTVTRVDPSGLATPVAVGHVPAGLAVGDGAVWVADSGDDAVVRIDPDTRAVTATIAVGQSPKGVALGAGSVWVADSGDGTVTRINARTGKVVATIAVGGSPQQVAVVGDRAWVTVDARTIAPARAARGGTARIDGYPVSSMDPAVSDDGSAWQLLYATCARLLTYPDLAGPAGYRLVPEVAQALPRRSPDGRTYTFTIREGFRFSPPSNEPVSAQTAKDTIERTLNPRTRSTVARQFQDIAGARAYMAGKATHVSGVVARGDTLTIRLVALSPGLPSRLAEPAMCVVPSGTPIDPKGVRMIPSAGPYRVASEAPGQGVVLTRNTNYRGARPHRLARIEWNSGVIGHHAVAQVEAGMADYAADGAVTKADAARLAARYGPGSPAARRGRQQYFVNPLPALGFLALNTRRPLFADVRLRRAVSYAIDRRALARIGDEGVPLPQHPTDHYLPPGVPGYRDVRIYSLGPDVAAARRLAGGHRGRTAVLYTCNQSPCAQQAQVIRTDLAAIGLRLDVRTFPDETLYTRLARPGEPFDIATVGWAPDYLEPESMLNFLLESGVVLPTFDDPDYRRRLDAAARLSGAERYLTYARLDADLTRAASPFVAYRNASLHELFSARMGCQIYGVYGYDLAALCIRSHA